MSTRQVTFGEQVEEPRELEEASKVKPTFGGIRDFVKQIRSDSEILESVLTLADMESKYKDPPKERGGNRGPRDAADIAMTTLAKEIGEAVWAYENVYKSYENWLKYSKNREDSKNRAGLKVWAKQMGEARGKLDDILDKLR